MVSQLTHSLCMDLLAIHGNFFIDTYNISLVQLNFNLNSIFYFKLRLHVNVDKFLLREPHVIACLEIPTATTVERIMYIPKLAT